MPLQQANVSLERIVRHHVIFIPTMGPRWMTVAGVPERHAPVTAFSPVHKGESR